MSCSNLMSRAAKVIVVLAALSLPPRAFGAEGAYRLRHDYRDGDFFSRFNFFTGPDPTSGFVDFKSAESAAQQSLVGYGADGSAQIYADSSTKIDPSAPGRPSVRLESKENYNHGLFMFDLSHMPSSTCGSWPALWLLGAGEWPNGGEIDIIEGVNAAQANSMTLHTTAGCSVRNESSADPHGTPLPGPLEIACRVSDAFMGTLATSNCDVNDPNQPTNAGCGIQAPTSSICRDRTATYGSPFNTAGGGIYAVEWNSAAISIWFWSRTLHPDFSTISRSFSQNTPDITTFGQPMARFSGACDIDAHFKDMRLIIDTTFCGAWAGDSSVWAASCAASTGNPTCESYVADNPSAFEESFWAFNAVKVFQQSTEKPFSIGKKAARAVKKGIVGSVRRKDSFRRFYIYNSTHTPISENGNRTSGYRPSGSASPSSGGYRLSDSSGPARNLTKVRVVGL